MTGRMIIGVGADEYGFALKERLRELLEADGRVAEVRDFGVREGTDHDPYPNVGLRVAEAVAAGDLDRAVLVCGTGIGMAITANKVPGVRATVAYDPYSVERSVLSNDCQVLALGAWVIGAEVARRIVADWLGYRFDPASASARKIAVITDYEAGPS
ncbi:D-erythrulose 4-phosphate isomerase DerI2 [Actinomadura vinacea]|uniref:D-erythrulose 4-phosphate isomerase DerI2 n=1 Tax=Actinomadura vinacea TaxID=115336 RepID=A0ABN3KGH8_9ACTN